MDIAPAITCSPQEATYLASLLGGTSLLGLEDPFIGWLTEEIQEVWEKARDELAGRRYIEIDRDNRIIMDTTTAALIGTWVFPDASFITTYTPAGMPSSIRYFHVTRRLAVEQVVVGNSCQLTAMEDAEAVYQRAAP